MIVCCTRKYREDFIVSEQQNQVIIYESADNTAVVEVLTDGDNVWLTQQQIAMLFESSRTNVLEHIQHIYSEGELERESTCRNFRQVQTEGKRKVSRGIPHYNLDMILSVGYRINSRRATGFRRWANDVLKRYLLDGAALNDKRLSQMHKAIDIVSRSAIPEIAGVSDVLRKFTDGLAFVFPCKGTFPIRIPAINRYRCSDWWFFS